MQQTKSLILILVKPRQNFAWVYSATVIIVICLLMQKKSLSLKPIMEMSTSQRNFFLRSISNKFDATKSREISLKGNVFDFSVNYNAIDKSDILNIHKYLMVKNNMK